MLEAAETVIRDFAGRFLVVISGQGRTRVYGDPAGSLPVVYNPVSGTVAATPLLALVRDIIPNPA
ncbi:hypothetical protein [Roseovarius salinarum]|uniref:hypothetical protein n=1 Tax=Roseovarius salinarum TaxID=1981892 RepID=UPI000C32371C|nr:hypothetical protein [Roseovarius salinarum]